MKTTNRPFINAALACIIAATLLAGCDTRNDAITQAEKHELKAPGIAETRAIAEAGFIYGLPIVMNYAVMYEYAVDKDSGQFKAPFNQIKNEARVFTYKDTAIVTPNSDTPYSFLWMDLRTEPIVISVPAVEKDRYYAVQLEDGNTFNYGYIGSRATGNEAGDFMVVGPNWKGETPAGIKKVFHSTTQFSLAGFRTQLFNAEDMPNVVKIQAGYKVQPLSAFLGNPARPPLPTIDFPKIDKEHGQDRTSSSTSTSRFSLRRPDRRKRKSAPDSPASASVPVRPSTSRTSRLEHKVDDRTGHEGRRDKIEKYLATQQKSVNGWKIGSFFGDRAFFNGDWLLRAAGAKAGIYGNDSDRSHLPDDPRGRRRRTLDGSKHNYTLTFPAGQFPPVNAFWSVTMYDGKTQLLIKNPINRYLINSPMLPGMKKNADGSLTLYIQKESPGADKESNWLPAPNDTIYLVMRLYWPKTDPPSVLPVGEGSWQPPGIVKAD